MKKRRKEKKKHGKVTYSTVLSGESVFVHIKFTGFKHKAVYKAKIANGDWRNIAS